MVIESKKSNLRWIGRTEGNTGVIFDKNNENVNEIVDVYITDAQGVSLLGENILKKESRIEIN